MLKIRFADKNTSTLLPRCWYWGELIWIKLSSYQKKTFLIKAGSLKTLLPDGFSETVPQAEDHLAHALTQLLSGSLASMELVETTNFIFIMWSYYNVPQFSLFCFLCFFFFSFFFYFSEKVTWYVSHGKYNDLINL